MTTTITLPLWAFLLLILFAAWAALERLLLPGVRWYFRRRVNLVIDEINTRLNVELPHFKLTRRQVLVDRLFHDERVQEAVSRVCREDKIPRSVALARVDRYAREIVPAFNAYLYFRIGYWIAKRVVHSLYRLRFGYIESDALAQIDPKSSIVFVMNHRSNMDYVLVAFLAAERVALSYAVGEWARIWPLQQLVRSMGAYFVRRNSGDPLYRMVLQRYVQMATQAGVPQAVYPEGGLSVDGTLRTPKLGLLDYMLREFRPEGERDLVFIPVGINYDRVLEDRSLLRKIDGSAPPVSIARGLMTSFGFVMHNMWLALTGRWYRFGYACVNFGAPISLRAYVREHGLDFSALDDDARREPVARFGRQLMDEIGNIVPVLPVSLVATVLMRSPDRRWSELELKSAASSLMEMLMECSAHIHVPRADRDYAISVGLRMLTLRHVVLEDEGLYRVNPDDLDLIAYYANAIAPSVARALPSTE